MNTATSWGLAAFLAALTCGACAQSYPSKQVKLVVPQAAGGATDVFARHLAQKRSLAWNQPVVVENCVGAAGVAGTDVVAKSTVDSHTLLFTYAGSQAVNPSRYPTTPFDSVNDLVPITPLATTAFFLVVGAHSPVHNFREWLGVAKAHPGQVTYATSGKGSINYLLSESLNVEVGIETVHVPYKAIAMAMTDFFREQGSEVFTSSPEEFRKMLEADVVHWAKVVKSSGAKLD